MKYRIIKGEKMRIGRISPNQRYFHIKRTFPQKVKDFLMKRKYVTGNTFIMFKKPPKKPKEVSMGSFTFPKLF